VSAGTLTIILQLVFLEGILSIDNAAVLGAMVAYLPVDRPVPWPKGSRFTNHLTLRLGPQREAALKVGLLGAYGGRALMLALAGLILQVQWVRVLGALYLLYLGIAHLGRLYRPEQGQGDHVPGRRTTSFWATVAATIMADLAFSIDNVIAAVALSDTLWIVLAGVGIGMVMMRFAANLFSQAIRWEPALETGAYLLLLAIGIELLLKEFAAVHIDESLQFAISAGILALTISVARTPILYPTLRRLRPLLVLFALVNWLVDGARDLVLSPFRRRLPSAEAPGSTGYEDTR
jgi:tellurite resistance protein TerC